MITTIQLNDNVKMILSRLKKDSKETYEDVIVRMIKTIDKTNNKKEAMLRKGYEEMADETAKINKEWLSTNSAWD